MANNEVSVFKANIEGVIGNPAAMQRICLSQLEAMYNGEIDIVDPSNPFIFLMEASTLLSSVAIEQNAINNRKQYPSVAVSEDEIYLHMSDEDYIDRFAKPSMAKFTILLNLDEIVAKIDALPLINPNTNGNMDRKLVIPRHSEFTIAEHKFTMQYPIEIRKLSHGGLQIVYDVESVSPILTLESNLVKWFTTRIDGNNFIAIETPIQQIEIKEFKAPLNISAGFIKTYLLPDKYYYCRAFLSTNQDNVWEEIKTTHSDQIFDPTKPTLLLKVFSDSLKVEMPTIYFTSGLVNNRELRIDIYTTKGPVELILSSYVSNQYQIKWKDWDNQDKGIYSSPLNTVKSLAVYSVDTVSGGGNAISFSQLRERVIENAVGAPDTPITNTQIVTTLDNAGFSVVKNLDNITDRQFLATREIPNAATALAGVTDISLLANVSDSPIATAISTVQATIDELVLLNNVFDNTSRITIASNTLFEDINGVVKPVTNDALVSLNALPKEILIDTVNTSRYSYVPFHYVLDTNNDNFALRPYYLDKPLAIAKQFLDENEDLGLEISIGKYSIEKIATGYRIYLVTASGTNLKEFHETNPNDIHLQVSFRPSGNTSRGYLDATIKDPELIYGTGQTVVPEGEILYEVLLETNYDIDSNDDLYLNNFYVNEILRDSPTALTIEMDFIIYVTNFVTTAPDVDLDRDVVDWFSVGSIRGVVKERITFELGKSLEYLWSNCRTLLSPEAYLRYTVNVPKIYTEDVYEMDPVTGLKKMTIVDGAITFNKLHSVGDPYLDELLEPIYDHLIGDIVVDIDGNPVPVDQRKVTRQIDLCFFDGTYYFVTESTNKLYKEQVPSIIVSWLENDLTYINSRLLERTSVFFYPKTTFGTAKIIIENGVIVSTYSEQSFTVKAYVDGNIYESDSIKNSIRNTIVDTLATALKGSVVSLTDVQFNIKTILGNLVKGVELSGFGENKNISTFTVYDDTIRASIKKTLLLLSESNISIKDDVNVEFIRHEL